ncbi:MAG: hypothetical protein ACWA5P_12105, partial [bacterium]
MRTAINSKYLTKLFFTLSFLMIGFISSAQVLDEFTPRFNETVNGDFTMIANNMISRDATAPYNGSFDNHNFSDNVYVDIDSDPTTFNSSNATYANPEPSLECLEVKKAYLYWAAADKGPTAEVNSENQPDWNFNDVKVQLPGEAGYTTYTADDVIFRGKDLPNGFQNDPYICFKDLTDEVKALDNPYGVYQIANVEAKIGSLIGHEGGFIGTSGGWQMVFIYESISLPAKNIGIFDGYAHVTSVVNDFDINFSGFQTVPSGNVNARVLIGSSEGDQSLVGDRLQIRNTAGNFVDINAGTIRPTNNFFNSRITVNNNDFIDRVPASLNTLGFDAAVFDLDNTGNSIIGNNQSSKTLRLASNQETYGLFLLGLSVDQWAPDLRPVEVMLTSGSNPVNPGDSIGLGFTISNQGNDDAVNVSISTTVPEQVADVIPGTLPTGVNFSYDPITGFLEFTIDDGFLDVNDPSLDIDFEFVIEDECYFLEDNCNLSFDLQFDINYNGVENPSDQSGVSSSDVGECNVGDELPLTININQPFVNWATAPGALDRTVECDDVAALEEAQSLEPETDKCDFTLVKTSGDFVPDANCNMTGTYTNTWSFTDACGVTIEDYVQVITVIGGSALEFDTPLPVDITVECDNIPDPDVVTATVGCGTAVATLEETITEGSCTGQFVITRTWTATDTCGDSITHTQTITVQDTAAPTIDVEAADVTVECDGNGNTTDLQDWL